MPSPSADAKFVLSILKFLSMLKSSIFLSILNMFYGILKSEILLHKLAHLSILKKIESFLKFEYTQNQILCQQMD
jgi:hypothetical protein